MEVMQWHHDTVASKTVEALKKHDFDAIYFADKEKAIEYILGFVKAGQTVGFGGSATTAELGLPEKAKAMGAVVLNHNEPGLTPEQKLDIRRKQIVSDLFLTSVNAVTMDGCIFSVDGAGNRVSAMTFGPKKVIAVVGTNKIRRDLDEAHDRVRYYAAPMNNRRLGTSNPCTVTGTCADCEAKTRICRVYSILKRKPSFTDITVVLVGTALGY